MFLHFKSRMSHRKKTTCTHSVLSMYRTKIQFGTECTASTLWLRADCTKTPFILTGDSLAKCGSCPHSTPDTMIPACLLKRCHVLCNTFCVTLCVTVPPPVVLLCARSPAAEFQWFVSKRVLFSPPLTIMAPILSRALRCLGEKAADVLHFHAGSTFHRNLSQLITFQMSEGITFSPPFFF